MSPEATNPASILLVDDTPTNLEILVEYFADRGFDVSVARNGEKALKLIDANPPDLILLDVMMPGIDGFETCRRIKSNPQTKDIPIIFMTALSETREKVEGFRTGAVDYVTKPIQLEEVLARVNTHLTLQRLRGRLQESNAKLQQEIESRKRAQEELQQANETLEQRVVERTEQLRQTLEEKQRIASELQIASGIQRSILPQRPLVGPEYEICGKSCPARVVGGDFYDYFPIDDDRIGFVIADVSDKGMPAALFMAVTRTLVKSTALTGIAPGECLRRVNNLLHAENDSFMFVTVFLGIMNARTGEVVYSNGGHHVPYLLTKNARIQVLEKSSGMALGVIEDVTFETKTLTLLPGDALFLYTDGVTEAVNKHESFYSEQGLKEFLTKTASWSPAQIVQDLLEDVERFSDKSTQDDDMTLLSLRYTGAAPSTDVVNTTACITIRNTLSDIEHISQRVQVFGEKHGFSSKLVSQLKLVLEEILTNVMTYGYDDQDTHHITVRVSCCDGEVIAEVEDDGRPFNPLEAPPPDLVSPVEIRLAGGLGVHIVRSVMETIEYRREGHKNYLVLRKRLDG